MRTDELRQNLESLQAELLRSSHSIGRRESLEEQYCDLLGQLRGDPKLPYLSWWSRYLDRKEQGLIVPKYMTGAW